MKYILKLDKTKEELSGCTTILPVVMMHDGEDISIFNGDVDQEAVMFIEDGKLKIRRKQKKYMYFNMTDAALSADTNSFDLANFKTFIVNGTDVKKDIIEPTTKSFSFDISQYSEETIDSHYSITTTDTFETSDSSITAVTTNIGSEYYTSSNTNYVIILAETGTSQFYWVADIILGTESGTTEYSEPIVSNATELSNAIVNIFGSAPSGTKYLIMFNPGNSWQGENYYDLPLSSIEVTVSHADGTSETKSYEETTLTWHDSSTVVTLPDEYRIPYVSGCDYTFTITIDEKYITQFGEDNFSEALVFCDSDKQILYKQNSQGEPNISSLYNNAISNEMIQQYVLPLTSTFYYVLKGEHFDEEGAYISGETLPYTLTVTYGKTKYSFPSTGAYTVEFEMANGVTVLNGGSAMTIGITGLSENAFEDVTEIADGQFSGCKSLTTIPPLYTSLNRLGQTCFMNTGVSTKALTYKGTIAEFNNVTIGQYVFGPGGYTVHCSDGDKPISK